MTVKWHCNFWDLKYCRVWLSGVIFMTCLRRWSHIATCKWPRQLHDMFKTLKWHDISRRIQNGTDCYFLCVINTTTATTATTTTWKEQIDTNISWFRDFVKNIIKWRPCPGSAVLIFIFIFSFTVWTLQQGFQSRDLVPSNHDGSTNRRRLPSAPLAVPNIPVAISQRLIRLAY